MPKLIYSESGCYKSKQYYIYLCNNIEFYEYFQKNLNIL